jgi:hypothetical protein
MAEGFGPEAPLMKSLEVLGGEKKVCAEARRRVLKRLSWSPAVTSA